MSFDEMEAIRREHLPIERTARLASLPYCLAALVFARAIGLPGDESAASESAAMMGVVSMFVVLGLGAMALGLCRLRDWARWPTVICLTFGLLAFPVGTLICPFLLMRLLSPRAELVFSPAYRKIIAATPHM